MRSEGAKVFDVEGGGSHVAQIFSGPIHYRDDAGRWQDIDPSIVPAPGGFRNGAHEFDVFFPQQLSQATQVDVDHGGASLSFGVAGASTSEAVASETSITYPGVFEDADLTYEMTYDGYKENLVLRSPAAPSSVTYTISTRGLDLVALEDGRIEVRRGARPVGYFTRLFAEEAAAADGTPGEMTYEIDTSLRQVSPSAYELTAAIDQSWLSAPRRRFPVVLDPSFVNSNCGACSPGTGVPQLKDMSYSTGQSMMGYENHGTLRVGRDTYTIGGREAKTYMTFDISQEVRKIGDLVYEANFDIYNHQHSVYDNGAVFELKRITSDWSENQVTGPPPPVDESTLWSQYTPCQNFYCPRGWWRWDVRDLLQYWLDKGVGSNHGWRLSASTEPTSVLDMRDMLSKESGGSRPYLFVAVNAMPSTRAFTVGDAEWPHLDLAPDALANGAVVSGQPTFKIKDLTDTNQDPIVVRYQVSRSSSTFAGPDLVHDSGWIPETQQYTVPSSMSSGTHYWRVLASDTCGAAYVDKDDAEAASAGLCDDLSHDWGRPHVGTIERPLSEVRWFSVGPGGVSGMRAHATSDVDAAGAASSLTLDSVEGFSSTGGQATFEPDTSAREVFSYSGVDRSTNRLLGLTRPTAKEHAEGTVVQAGTAPAQTAPHNSVDLKVPPPMGPYEVVPPPSQTWLDAHCVVDDPGQASHATQPLLLYSGFVNAPESSGYARPIRDIMFVADRPYAEAHPHFQQHMRLVCDRNVDGTWRRVAVRTLQIPQSEDTNPQNVEDGDPDNNYDASGRIDCDEFQAFLQSHGVYGQTDIRPLVFLDKSINTGGPYKGNCSFGTSKAWFTGDPKNPHNPESWSPGITNPNNTMWGYGASDADRWTLGASGDTAGTAAHEFGHSIGIVPYAAPGQGAGHHTRDFPDVMNRGYFHPSTEEGVQNNCRETRAWERMTNKPNFIDCGRDTYWAPFAPTSNWLCNHYNLAWDSLYLQPRAARTPGCLS